MKSLKEHPAIIAVISVSAVLAAASVGYLLGHSSGEELDAARGKGEEAGRIAGEKQGTEQGRRAGQRAGFKAGYESAYRKAFEEAGLDAPEDVEVPAG